MKKVIFTWIIAAISIYLLATDHSFHNRIFGIVMIVILATAATAAEWRLDTRFLNWICRDSD